MLFWTLGGNGYSRTTGSSGSILTLDAPGKPSFLRVRESACHSLRMAYGSPLRSIQRLTVYHSIHSSET